MKEISIDDLAGITHGMEYDDRKVMIAVPGSYLCSSVSDYLDNRRHIKERYSAVVLDNVLFRPEIIDDRLQVYIFEEEKTCINFLASDESGYTEIFWPDIEKYNLSSDLLESFLENPREVDALLICYDSKYDNPFLMNVVEDTYEVGVKEIMNDIWKMS